MTRVFHIGRHLYRNLVNRHLALVLAGALLLGSALAQPVKITFWHIFDGGPAKEFIDETIAEFNAAHPDIEVEGLGINFFDYWTKLTTAMAAGTAPDVFLNDLGNVPSRAADGVLLPLEALTTYGDFSLDDYWPVIRDKISYQGSIYALPWETDVRALYYNKDAFRAAGLDPEKPPTTWEELAEYSDALTQKNGPRLTQVGFNPNWGNVGLATWVWLNGGSFQAEDGSLRLNGPRAVEALAWMVERAQAYGLRETASFEAGFGGGAADPFVSGRVAMIVQNNTFPGVIAQYAPDLDYGVAAIPYNREPASWSNGFSIEASADTEHPQAALELLKYLTSEEVQAAYAQINFSMVGNREAALAPELMENPVWQTMVEQMEVTHFRPFSPEVPTYYDQILLPEVQAALLGRKTPAEALDDAQKNYEAAVQRYRQTQ